jgi:hypothetical protein
MKRLILNFLATAAVVWGGSPGLGVIPILDCVTNDGGLFTAYWGYADTNAVPSTILNASPNNYMEPSKFFAQKVVFDPGVFHGAFYTFFDPSLDPTVTWHLNGFSVTASNDPALYCPSAQNSCWDTNNNGVCDLASEDINGDGKCDALDCQGRVGAQGATGPGGSPGQTGPQGSPGSPGISPSIATIIVPTATASATASCTTPQVLLNGGGSCTVPNSNAINGRIASSAPSGSNGWTVSCSAGQATAIALCAAK